MKQTMTELDRRRARARRVDRLRRRGLITVISAAVLVLVVGLPWLIWRGPYVLDGKYIDRKALGEGSAALITGLRTATVTTVAALGAGIALLYTARTYRLTRRGQITDRFTKALERLDSSQIYVRIGGILALEQIVRDAPGQAATDAARVLGHFIRDRAPRVTSPLDPDTDERVPLRGEPEADVQAALTALTRAESRIHVDPRESLNLHGLHLAGAKLNRADLTGADLSEAVLTGADLVSAVLTNADLSWTTLTMADLDMATLTGTSLEGADLTEANLTWVTLAGADLLRATLTNANLIGATLTGASLFDATLTGTSWAGATMTKADLCAADLSDAHGLTPGQVTSARTDGSTVLPPRFHVIVQPTPHA